MIGFRNYDSRFPFLWESGDQPEGRWHASGDGPAHYLADTPDGAWAEFIRHEEITSLEDLAEVRRGLCAIDFDDTECDDVSLPVRTLRGGVETYEACQTEASRMRGSGSTGLRAPSAALKPGGASGFIVRQGLVDGPARDGTVYVLFGQRPELVGWVVVTSARPPVHVLFEVSALGGPSD